MSRPLADLAPWSLPVHPGAGRQLARAFLWLGVAALIGSGILAIVLVLARTPGVASHLALRDIFRAALVVHVDLSVLIWFMAFAGLLWSLNTAPRWLPLGWLGWGLACLGTLVMTLSPFLPGAQPLLNNYIPVLQQPVFLTGLTLCGVGFGLTIARSLACGWRDALTTGRQHPLKLGVLLSTVAGALAWLAFGWTATHMPAIDGTAYFEILFWGPGHVLQFQHALLAMVGWLWLASAVGATPHLGSHAASRWFALAALPLLCVPLLYVVWPVGSPDHLQVFARLMEWGHLFLLPLMLGVVRVLPRVWRAPASPARSALLASMLLFCTGGLLAFMIRGVNVVVPAHYHGSIVGVTLAFMGLAYVLLPQLGFATATQRMARWQPYVYGGGQLMHILGLAWSGGYGVQRKVAGTDQVLTTLPEKLGMGMMGLGGLIAVIGGVMFVLVCLRAMTSRAGSPAQVSA